MDWRKGKTPSARTSDFSETEIVRAVNQPETGMSVKQVRAQLGRECDVYYTTLGDSNARVLSRTAIQRIGQVAVCDSKAQEH